MKRGNRRSIGSKSTGAVAVRRARETDLPALIELYRQLHLDDYSYTAPSLAAMRTAYRRIAGNRDHHIMVAHRSGVVAGTLHVMIFRHLGHGLRPVAIVENVVVSPTMRSRGIGEQLMEAAGTIARRNRCYKMSLTTNLKRGQAHRFYARLGWTKTHFGYSLGIEPDIDTKRR